MVLGSALSRAPSKQVSWLQANSASAIRLTGYPSLVGAAALEAQVGQSAGIPGTHAVLDTGVVPVAQFECGDVVASLVGDEVGVAPPGVSIEEGELGTRMGPLTAEDHPHVIGPAGQFVVLDQLGAPSNPPV
jgi:hypothetical protein